MIWVCGGFVRSTGEGWVLAERGQERQHGNGRRGGRGPTVGEIADILQAT